MKPSVIVMALLLPRTAAAHTGAHGPQDIWQTWTLEPWVLALLASSALAYAAGWERLRARVRSRTSGSSRPRLFSAALAALIVALVSPIDALGELLFSGHMTQHLLLTLVAAPLLVLSDAGTIFLWALPRGGRRATGRFLRLPAVRLGRRALSSPLNAWGLHTAALILWHVPALYELAIADARIHALEHWSFLTTAWLFWWPVLAPRTRQRLGFGTAVVYLFTAATASAILGAMIAMSGEAWYAVHARWTPAWGLTPLEDQQLAGLIMWVPAAAVYLGALVPIVVRGLAERAALRPA